MKMNDRVHHLFNENAKVYTFKIIAREIGMNKRAISNILKK